MRRPLIVALVVTSTIAGCTLFPTAASEELIAETIGVISADLGDGEYVLTDGRRVAVERGSRTMGYTQPAVGHVLFAGSTPWAWTYTARPPSSSWWETVKDYQILNAVRPAPGECFVVGTSDPYERPGEAGARGFSMRDGKIYVRTSYGHPEAPQPADLVLSPADGFTTAMFDEGASTRADSLCVNEEGRVWAFDLNTR